MQPVARGITAGRHAKRVNAAVRMIASGLSVAEAARELARRHGVSERQARRYAEQARDVGSAEIPKPKTVFTVKIPVVQHRARRPCRRLRPRSGWFHVVLCEDPGWSHRRMGF